MPRRRAATSSTGCKCVGWKGKPEFEPGAFAAIFEATGGIPRRINALCDRLLLSGFLAGSKSVSTRGDVEEVVREIREEAFVTSRGASRIAAGQDAPTAERPRPHRCRRRRRSSPASCRSRAATPAFSVDPLAAAMEPEVAAEGRDSWQASVEQRRGAHRPSRAARRCDAEARCSRSSTRCGARPNRKARRERGRRQIAAGPVICVVGARPNFMKMAPILRAFAAHSRRCRRCWCTPGSTTTRT